MLTTEDYACKCGCGDIIIKLRVVSDLVVLNCAWDIWQNNHMDLDDEHRVELGCSSGYRCLFYDWSVNPDPDSTRQHTRGTAVDLVKSDGPPFSLEESEWIKAAAAKLGFTGIGLYDTSMHLDRREPRFITNPTIIEGRKVQLWDRRSL